MWYIKLIVKEENGVEKNSSEKHACVWIWSSW